MSRGLNTLIGGQIPAGINSPKLQLRLDDAADWMQIQAYLAIPGVTKTTTIRYININPHAEKFMYMLDVIVKKHVDCIIIMGMCEYAH